MSVFFPASICSYPSRVVARRQIRTRLHWLTVFRVPASRNRICIVFVPYSVKCQSFLPWEPVSPEGGHVIWEVLRCRLIPKRSPTEIQISPLQAHVLTVRNWMRTHRWIDDFVSCTLWSGTGQIYRSYPGVLRRNLVGAWPFSCFTFWPHHSSGNLTQLLADASDHESRLMFRKTYSRTEGRRQLADRWLSLPNAPIKLSKKTLAKYVAGVLDVKSAFVLKNRAFITMTKMFPFFIRGSGPWILIAINSKGWDIENKCKCRS